MQIAGLTFKPLAQWSRHALLTTWSFCVLALLILALRESSVPPRQDGMMNTAILLLQSLALLPMRTWPPSSASVPGSFAMCRHCPLSWAVRCHSFRNVGRT